MTFRIEHALYEDIDTLYDVYLQAHLADPLYPYLYPGMSWAEQVKFESTGPKEAFLRHPWVHYHKVVEVETGYVIPPQQINLKGMWKLWGRWHFPHALRDEERKESFDKDYFPEIPEGANTDLVQDWFDKILAAEERYIDREKGYFINYLAVHPDYQRKGLSSMLLRIGLDAADRDNAETFLIATAKGAPLYSKVGFKEVGRLEVDTGPYGGEGIVSYLSVIRKPSAGRPGSKP